MCNNLVKSDTYIAFVRNAFIMSKVVIYKLNELENQNLHSDLISQQLIEWESKEKECTYINYIFINQRWYLLVCFVGSWELYCEDGSKKYFTGKSTDNGKNESSLMDGVFISSCVASAKNNGGQTEEFLMLGTSKGEIYQISIAKNNTVTINEDKMIKYKDGTHAITSMAADS